MTFKKNSNSKKPAFLMVVCLFILISIVLFFLNARQVSEQEQPVADLSYPPVNNAPNQMAQRQPAPAEADSTTIKQHIDELTAEQTVLAYLQTYQKLPKYYMTKRQAQNSGWDARRGNLCEVLPGKAIGGDRFSNREKLLPSQRGRIWYEADINYRCGRRGADRLIYSSDGLIYVTQDHYQHFRLVKR